MHNMLVKLVWSRSEFATSLNNYFLESGNSGNFVIVGYQQNRVPHFHRKNYPPRKNYGPRPTTAGSGLNLLKTKAKGQAPEPPSAPPLHPTSLCLARPSWRHLGARALWRHQGARPLCTAIASLDPPTVTHCHWYARALSFPVKEQELPASCRIT
jgi:hypothetical protein